MPDKTVRSLPHSRYKDTPKLEDSEGNVFIDLWVEPLELATDSVATITHTPIDSEIGRLDLLANQYYESVNAWWTIASRNGLRDQVEDMSTGMQKIVRFLLVIPRRVAVQNFLGR